ncbi:MAG: GDSL-type esterase/lipase family protein [Myxococcota bacterium]|nr:GDSL-type esterase/lipase family protein [Myxococcota bacterium]
MKLRATLVATAIIASLCLAEAALRAFDRPRFDACDATADYAIPDPELGFRGEPGGEVAGVRLNEHGWRGPALASPKPPGERRILFVGDSTCYGIGVDLADTFAARTAEALGSRFLLGAFPGYSSYHSAIVLDRLLRLEPDLVVFYVGARNDGSRARYFPDEDIPKRRARLRAPWHDVRLLRLVEVVRDRGYRRLVRPLRSREARARVPPDVFRSNLRQMVQRLDRAGIEGVIVIPPLSPSFEASQPQMRRYREILAEIAAEHQLRTVSLEDRFEAVAPSRVYFEDKYHLQAPGHAIVAEEITRLLAPR